MSEHEKAGPEGGPAGVPELAERFREGGTQPADDRELRVRLEVSGGTAGERYRFEFTALESGEVAASLHDELRGIDERTKAAEPLREQVQQLFRAVDVPRLAEASRGRQPIPPCSVVGRLTVSDGRQDVTVVYMADPGQAEDAGFRPHPAVEAVVGEVHALAARQLGLKTVAP
jgi:hypothetical protein